MSLGLSIGLGLGVALGNANKKVDWMIAFTVDLECQHLPLVKLLGEANQI